MTQLQAFKRFVNSLSNPYAVTVYESTDNSGNTAFRLKVKGGDFHVLFNKNGKLDYLFVEEDFITRLNSEFINHTINVSNNDSITSI